MRARKKFLSNSSGLSGNAGDPYSGEASSPNEMINLAEYIDVMVLECSQA